MTSELLLNRHKQVSFIVMDWLDHETDGERAALIGPVWLDAHLSSEGFHDLPDNIEAKA